MISNKEDMISSRPKDRSLEDVTPTTRVKSHQMIFETCPYVERTGKLSLKNDHSYVRTLKRDVSGYEDVEHYLDVQFRLF